MDTTGKLPAVDCTDWCERGDGHSNVSHPEAQYCVSEGRSVTLSRHPLLSFDDGSRLRDTLTAVLYRDSGAATAHVVLSRSDFSAFELSLSEAKQLGSALLRLANTAGA